MQSKKINETTFLIRIKRGEYIIKNLYQFCKDNQIEGGFFSGIGAVDEIELALYDVAKKQYFSKKFTQAFELSNLTGTIGIEEDLIIHTHATVGDENMDTKAGHLIDARISGTLELYLKVLPKLTKRFDNETGLKLFDLEI
jgi:predicted DNA-binding protein with PD1-like motif